MTDFATERETMVAVIKRAGVSNKAVLQAMLKVPRHLFVSPHSLDAAYADSPLPIDCEQTISQPYIVALMTEAAEVNSQSKVLEIGTGSGYQTAILAELCKEVFTMERLAPLAKSAAVLLKTLGYQHVHATVGNGYVGWQEAAPFDAILVTAAADSLPEALLQQLAVGGRMIIPITIASGAQFLYKIFKTSHENHYTSQELLPVRFVKMLR